MAEFTEFVIFIKINMKPYQSSSVSFITEKSGIVLIHVTCIRKATGSSRKT